MATSELELFDRLGSSFKAAAEYCDQLASAPKKGPIYYRLREELRLIEGACRQVGCYREDMRWMKVGLDAHKCHENAGDWLRSFAPAKYFTALAVTMRKLHAATEKLRHNRTGRTGMILPKAQHLHRDTRPVGWTASQAGILLPPGAAAA